MREGEGVNNRGEYRVSGLKMGVERNERKRCGYILERPTGHCDITPIYKYYEVPSYKLTESYLR
jgi:hypothetical protein